MGHPPFSPRMQLDRQQTMWDLWHSGMEMSQAAGVLGVDRKTVYNRISGAGGIRPRRRQTRSRLSFEDRVHIEVALKMGRSMRAIAADLGRQPSTITREVKAHARSDGRYLAKRAHAISFDHGRRPQQSKIEAVPALKAAVLTGLLGAEKCSPEQIAGRLRREHPDDPTMNVHHETIYRWIYLQPRGELKREVTAALRSGRAMRRPHKHGRTTGQGQIPDMVSIHDRPPLEHPDGTRIPGHWEGDLIIGKANASAIGTVVERATGYLLLLHLPNGRGVEQVTTALTKRLQELPDTLRQSLTWDQGKELSNHKTVSIDAAIDIYFADPHTPCTDPRTRTPTGCYASTSPRAPT